LLSQVVFADNTREEFTFSSQRFQLTNKKVIKTTNGNTLFEVTYNYQASAGQAGPQAGCRADHLDDRFAATARVVHV
jgi:hypothetical protein